MVRFRKRYLVWVLVAAVAILATYCLRFILSREETLPVQYERLQEGMSRPEVLAILGRPTSVDTSQGGNESWDYMEWREGPYSVYVILERRPRQRFDKVSDYGFRDDGTFHPLWRLRRWVQEQRAPPRRVGR